MLATFISQTISLYPFKAELSRKCRSFWKILVSIEIQTHDHRANRKACKPLCYRAFLVWNGNLSIIISQKRETCMCLHYVFLLISCYFCVLFSLDLGRMYQLVSRIQDGLHELRSLLEKHILNQGLSALETCGEDALNVGFLFSLQVLCLSVLFVCQHWFIQILTLWPSK